MMNSRKQETDLLNDSRVRQNAPGKHGSPKRSRCQFAAKKQRDQYTGAMLLVDHPTWWSLDLGIWVTRIFRSNTFEDFFSGYPWKTRMEREKGLSEKETNIVPNHHFVSSMSNFGGAVHLLEHTLKPTGSRIFESNSQGVCYRVYVGLPQERNNQRFIQWIIRSGRKFPTQLWAPDINGVITNSYK